MRVIGAKAELSCSAMTKVEAERRDEEEEEVNEEEVKEEGNENNFFTAWRNIIWSGGKKRRFVCLLPNLFR